MKLPRPIYVLGAGAVGPHGVGWRGMARAFSDGGIAPSIHTQLEESHPNQPAFQAPPWSPQDDPTDVKQQRMMSRPARLAAVAMKNALSADVDVTTCGLFLGVGPTAGALADLTALFRASVHDGTFDPEWLGTRGLQACHPFFAFQLMNNFPMCHAAIACGLQGPNAALFSRGEGTVTALEESIWALLEELCPETLTGGADSALHAATWVQLRQSREPDAVIPGEAAAVLRIGLNPHRALARVTHVETGCVTPPDNGTRVVVEENGPAEGSLTPLWGHLQAAGPAMGWCVALDLIASQQATRVSVVSRGVGESHCVVVFERVTP